MVSGRCLTFFQLGLQANLQLEGITFITLALVPFTPKQPGNWNIWSSSSKHPLFNVVY